MRFMRYHAKENRLTRLNEVVKPNTALAQPFWAEMLTNV